MRAFRIGSGLHPVFDGTGAEIQGGRWNSPGRRVIYAGESFAIAMLERLINTGIGRIPRNDRFVTITIDEALVRVEIVDPATVPGWHHPSCLASRAYGDQWYDQRRTAVLVVRSAVTRIDQNNVLNQIHAEFANIAASPEGPVNWDARLFARGP